jgi:PAS domain S-box-containing protein
MVMSRRSGTTMGKMPLKKPAKPDEEKQSLVAELQIHRTELQAQNRELSETRRQVEQSRDRYEDLFDFSPIAYLILDASGVIRDLNLTGAALLGLARRAAIGTPFIALVQGEFQSAFWDHMERCRRGALNLSTDLELKVRGGARLPVALVTAPNARPDAPIEFRTAVIDLRERRLIAEQQRELTREHTRYEEADRANRTRDELLALLAHELRAPLSAIDTWTHLLSTGRLAEDEKRRAIEVIEHNVRVQASLISEMLEVSRIIRGTLQIEMVPVDLVSLIQGAVESLAAHAGSRDVRIETRLDPAATTGLGDATRIQQVVSNLLSTAIKRTPDGGRIDVRLERSVRRRGPNAMAADGASGEPCARFTIIDGGPGITPEELPFAFERLWEHRSPAERSGGLGLGLAIIKRLVEMHDGTITVESRGDRGRPHGAAFIVELPLDPERADAPHRKRNATTAPETPAETP